MKRQLFTFVGLSSAYSCLCLTQHRQPLSPRFSIGHRQASVLAPFKRPPYHDHHATDLKRKSIERRAPRISTALYAENLGDDQTSVSGDSTVSLSQRILPRGYVLCKYLFASTSLFIFATPDRSLGTMLRQQWAGGAGYACAAALCGILHSAQAAGRQGSDTYKRLHTALALFSIISLAAVPGEAGFFRLSQQKQVISLLTSVRALGALVALWGWNASLQKPIHKEIVSGCVQTLKGLRVVNRKKALAYRNSLLIVLSAGISSFLQGRFLLSYQQDFLKTNFEISLQWSAVARLSMLAMMIFSLKDAAERDRLDGTTFIQLNVIVGLVAVAAGLGQASYPAGAAARRGALFFFFSGLFFLKAYKGNLAKQKKQ